MNDILDRVSGEEDFLTKIIKKIPGFKGYIKRTERREADKILRENIADSFESLWGKISEIQKKAVSDGNLEIVDDLESAAIKLRQFIDRIRHASYGYAGFFDAIKVNEEELDAIYQYDIQILSLEDEVGRAIENIEVSMGTEGLPASIRHLTKLAQNCVDTYNQRKDVIVALGSTDLKESE